MESPAEDRSQLQPHSPDAVALHHSEIQSSENLAPNVQEVLTENQPTTEQAVLRILTAVENISSKYDRDYVSPSDGSSEDEKAEAPRSGTESVVVQNEPRIERLLMSRWQNPWALLESFPYYHEKIVLTAFYTDLPETVRANEDSVPDPDFKAAYSKDKWSSGPQRILIHNKGFINDLRQIIGLPDTQRTGVLSMVPPFKHLIHNRHAIKSKLDELKQTASNRDAAPTTSTNSPAEGDLKIKYLQHLHDFIQTDLANYIGLELRIRDGELEDVLFQETYHLFRPGDLVLTAETGDSQLYQVSSVTGGRMLLSKRAEMIGPPSHRAMDTRPGTWTDLQVVCFCMGWDGENIGPRQIQCDLPYFSGRRLVPDLDLYPIQFHRDGSQLRKRLIVRGSKLIQSVGHKKYTGISVPPHSSLKMFLDRQPIPTPFPVRKDDSADDEEMKSNPFEMVRSDVYIDYKAVFVNYFSTLPLLSMVNRFPGEDAEAIDTLSDDVLWNCSDRDMDSLLSETFYNTNRHLTKFGKPKGMADDEDRLLLLPGQLPAFIFSSRKWEWLDLDNIQDIDKSEASRNSGWKELVIPDEFSELLLSLVSNHISDVAIRQWEGSTRHDSTVQIDLVRGKGRGLIILLHGPPGSGKTSTAETIAAYTGRPLYAITCGDLGTEPKELEKNLVKHTRLAEKWGCVLLLDEADVFLTSRNYHDIRRNAMVSIFLRQLEYYSGILFLTTNIIGVIDEAFKSRIHVALEYPAIHEESTLEIWRKMLQRIKRDNQKAEMKILFNDTALMKFAKKHYRDNRPKNQTWNARQIRNAFQTAIGIGQYERLKSIQEAEAQGVAPEKSSRYIRLTVASFETVAKTVSKFEIYMTRTRGDDRERAATNEFRRDEHSRDPPPRKRYPAQASSYRTELDTGSSRGGRSRLEMRTDRRYQGTSSSPVPKRSGKGKEALRRATRTSVPVSDNEDQAGRDSVYGSGSDNGSDEEIIEDDIEDEEGDEDAVK